MEMQTIVLCIVFILIAIFLLGFPWRFFINHFDNTFIVRPVGKFLLALLANVIAIIVVGVDATRNQEPVGAMVAYFALVCVPVAIYGLFRFIGALSNASEWSPPIRGILFTIATLLPAAGLLIANIFGVFSAIR